MDRQPERLEEVDRLHHRIVRAIERRDRKQARDAMRRHGSLYFPADERSGD